MAGFFDFDNLRRKPKKERQKIAIIFSALFTLVVFAGWFVMAWRDFGSEPKQAKEDSQKLTSPLASLKQGIDSIMDSGYRQYQGIKKEFEDQTKLFTESTEVIKFEDEDYGDIKFGQSYDESENSASSSEELIKTSSSTEQEQVAE